MGWINCEFIFYEHKCYLECEILLIEGRLLANYTETRF